MYFTQGSSAQTEEDRSSQDTDTMETGERQNEVDEDALKKKSKLYHLDDSVVVWSDYLYGHFHPKTVSVIKDYSHER